MYLTKKQQMLSQTRVYIITDDQGGMGEWKHTQKPENWH